MTLNANIHNNLLSADFKTQPQEVTAILQVKGRSFYSEL